VQRHDDCNTVLKMLTHAGLKIKDGLMVYVRFLGVVLDKKKLGLELLIGTLLSKLQSLWLIRQTKTDILHTLFQFYLTSNLVLNVILWRADFNQMLSEDKLNPKPCLL
jgi:hypothetical protein